MNAATIDAAWQTETTPSERSVLVACAHEANAAGFLTLPVQAIAAKTGYGVRAVQRALIGLAARGHITRYRRRLMAWTIQVHPKRV